MMNASLESLELQSTRLSPPEIIRRMVTAQFISQAIYVVARCNLAELFVAGPLSAEAVAQQAGLHAPSVYRLLRALADAGIFVHRTDDTFELTNLGNCLRSNVPGSMRMAAILFNEEPYVACAHLLESVRTGETAFERVYGMGHFEYLAQNETAAQTFHEAMTDLTTVVGRAVVSSYDFSQVRSLVDVGAGEGLLLAAILSANPHLKGVLFEAPPAMPGAQRLMEQQQLSHRCELRAGNFFESVPTGGDTYLLKSVIHDWDDARSLHILRNVRKAMPEDGRLLIVERVLPDSSERFFGKLNDLIMLVVSGGMERTEAQYQQLLRESGFGSGRVIPTGTGFHVIEARPLS